MTDVYNSITLIMRFLTTKYVIIQDIQFKQDK